MLAEKDCSRKIFPSGLGTLRTSGLQGMPGGDYLFCHCPRQESGAWVSVVCFKTKLLIYRRWNRCNQGSCWKDVQGPGATDLDLGLVTNPIIPIPSYFFVFRDLSISVTISLKEGEGACSKLCNIIGVLGLHFPGQKCESTWV